MAELVDARDLKSLGLGRAGSSPVARTIEARHMNKRIGQRIHSKRRAHQRLGLDLTTADLNEIVNDIQDNKAKFIERLSNSRSIFRVLIKDRLAYVVYDKERKSICTVLADGMV